MLVYAAIDQMAWLSVSDLESNGKDFKAWVDKYMLPKNPLGCSSSDLWAARNGLLHTGTAESRDTRNGNAKYKIHYTFGGAVCTENKSTDTVIIKFEDLVGSYLAGILWFMEDLKADAVKQESANNKLKLTLQCISI